MKYVVQRALMDRMLIQQTLLVLTAVTMASLILLACIDNDRSQIGLILILLIIVSLFPSITRRFFDVFEARNVFVIGFVFYSYALLFSFLLFGRRTTLFGIEVSSDLLVQSAVVYGLAIIFFHLGYSSRIGRTLGFWFPGFSMSSFSYSRLAMAALIYLIVGIIALIFLMIKIGGFKTYLSLPYAERHLVLRGLGFLTIAIYIVNIGLLFLYSWLETSGLLRRRTMKVIYWSVIGLYGFLVFLTGRRGPFFFLVISLLAYHHYRVRRIPLRKLLIFGGIALFILFIWGRLRGNITAFTNISLEWFDPAMTEFGAAPFIFLWVLTHKSMEGYWLGMSYINAPLNLIPYILFPERPISPGEWLVKTFFPEFYAAGGGLGFSYIAEAYLNFGIAGPLIVSFIAGVLCNAIYSYCRARKMNVPSVILYAITIPWILLGIRSDFASLLKGYVVGTLLPTIVAIGFAARWRISKVVRR